MPMPTKNKQLLQKNMVTSTRLECVSISALLQVINYGQTEKVELHKKCNGFCIYFLYTEGFNYESNTIN